MKAEYDKLIYPLADTPEVQVLFDQREVISWKEAEEEGSLSQLIRWRQEQLVDIKYEVHTRNKVKTIRLVRSLLTEKQIEEEWAKLRQNAKKQKELLLCLSELSQEEPIAYFKNKGISTAVLNQGKEKGWLEFIESERYRDPYKDRVFDQTTALELNAEQKMLSNKSSQQVSSKKIRSFCWRESLAAGKQKYIFRQSLMFCQKIKRLLC